MDLVGHVIKSCEIVHFYIHSSLKAPISIKDQIFPNITVTTYIYNN